jgi:hypothetical protein
MSRRKTPLLSEEERSVINKRNGACRNADTFKKQSISQRKSWADPVIRKKRLQLMIEGIGKKICPICKKEYQPVNGKQKYCGSSAKKIGCSYRFRVEYNQDMWLRKYYNMSLVEYRAISKLQGNKCKICGKKEKTKLKLSVDHCHITNRVRGLLCDKCNRGLGHFGDDSAVLTKAIAYLKGELS